MKRDENETLCWIMRWGWMTWKRSLAFNNDDGKKLYNLFTKKNKKIKTNHHLLHLTPTLPATFSLCPCTLPWNRNQKTREKFSTTDQDRILRFRTADNNLHWPLPIRLHQLPHLPFSLSLGPPFLFLLLPLILLLFLQSLSLCTSEN